jgi:hypothetical protein
MLATVQIYSMVGRAFRCSVCGGNSFRHVTVPRREGSHQTTALYECAGCSVVFCDADAFNANEPGPPSSRGPKLPPATYEPEMQTYGKGPGGKG